MFFVIYIIYGIYIFMAYMIYIYIWVLYIQRMMYAIVFMYVNLFMYIYIYSIPCSLLLSGCGGPTISCIFLQEQTHTLYFYMTYTSNVETFSPGKIWSWNLKTRSKLVGQLGWNSHFEMSNSGVTLVLTPPIYTNLRMFHVSPLKVVSGLRSIHQKIGQNKNHGQVHIV